MFRFIPSGSFSVHPSKRRERARAKSDFFIEGIVAWFIEISQEFFIPECSSRFRFFPEI